MVGRRMDIGFQTFRRPLELGLMRGRPFQQSDSGGCGTRMRSPFFVHHTRCAVSSMIPKRVS
jgi:hypothetical protein